MKHLFLISILLLLLAQHACAKTCPSGEYWDQLQCKPCPLGTFLDGNLCQPCAAGTFAPFLRSLVCKPCPKGEYQPNTGQWSCLKCLEGTVSTEIGATSPYMCKPNPEKKGTSQYNDEKQPRSGDEANYDLNHEKFDIVSREVVEQNAYFNITFDNYHHSPEYSKIELKMKTRSLTSPCRPGAFIKKLSWVQEDIDLSDGPVKTHFGQTCHIYTAVNLGNHPSPLACQEAALKEPRCTGNQIMYSEEKTPVGRRWGCHCCKAINEFDCMTEENFYVNNENWDIYRYRNTPNVKGECCEDCVEGQYQDHSGKNKCEECDEGFFQSVRGQAYCNICIPGQYSKYRISRRNVTRGAITCNNCTLGQYQDEAGQSTCKPCWKGSYQDTPGSNTCKLCPAGSVSEVLGATSLVSCNRCPHGEYQPEKGKTECIKCPTGTFSNITEVSPRSCTKCDAGFYQDEEGQSQCKRCDVGHYQPNEGRDSCIKCNPGEFQNQLGQSKCELCDAGEFSNSTGTTTCSSCPKGMYQPNIGQSFCSNCGPGEYQDREGKSGCKKCPRGTYSFEIGNKNVSSCLKCGKGTFQNNTGQSSCDRCDEGRFQNQEGATSCKSCGAGNYSRVKGSIECEQCFPGTYQDEDNSTSCKSCEGGTYAPNFGTNKCEKCKRGGYCTDTSVANGGFIVCPAGTYNDKLESSTNAACLECPIGTFSLEVGAKSSSACEKCPPGQYQNETGMQACIPCESGSYQDEFGQDHCKECNIGNHINVTGSSKCNECPYPLANFEKGSHNCSFCRDGYYLADETIDVDTLHSDPRAYCKECPLNAKGTNCTAGTTLTDIPILAGYWRASKSTSQIYKCNFEDNCKGTTISNRLRYLGESTVLTGEYCNKGFNGTLCEACTSIDQYFDNVDGKCKNCRTTTLFIQLGISLVVILIFGPIIWTMKNRLTPLTITASSLSIQAKVKILISFYQIMTAFTDVYGVNIHSDVKQIFYFVTYFISFEFLSSFPLDCLGTTTVAYVISGIWPYLMCIFFWICLKIFKHARLCFKSDRRIVKDIANLELSQVIVIIFYFALPIVSKHIFDAKICEAFKVDDVGNGVFESYLVSSRTIECDMEKDSYFRELQICFWIFLLLWPCFTLLGFAAFVAKVFTSVHLERPSALAIKCQFLWGDFDPTSNIAIYWDIIDFTRKVFLIGFINFVDQNEGSNKLLRLTIATAVSSAFMLILLYVRPYRRSDDFQLAVVSSFLITLAFGLGYILQICENEEGACEKYIATGIDDHLGASILVTILVIGMLIIAFLAIIVQTRISPILRLKSTRHPPNLNLPENCAHHVFMSHRWEGGQDKCHSIARKLQLYMPGLKVWLDVDNLSNTSELEESVDSSVVFLLSYSSGYFERPNCRREFYRALFLGKPIVLVYSDDSFLPLKVVEAYESAKKRTGCEKSENIYLELITEECEKSCLPHDEGEERRSNIDFQNEIIQMLEKSQVPECDCASKVTEMRHEVELFISKIHLQDNTSEQGETKSTLLQVEDNTNAGGDSTSEQVDGYSSLSQEENNVTGNSDALAIQWLKEGSFSSESLKLIYLRILSALPHYNSDASAPLLRKGLKLPNDEKTPKLKFQVEVLFSSQNQGVQNIADEIKSLYSQSITIIDLSRNEEKNDEENQIDSFNPQDIVKDEVSLVMEENVQDALVEKSEIESFLVTPPDEDDDIVYESSSNSLPSCFSLESMGLPHEQDASKESSSVNQSLEENKETSCLLEDRQITSSIVEYNHVLSSQLESSAFKVFLLYLNEETFPTDTNSKNLLEPILRVVVDKNVPVIVLHEQDFAKGARPDFGYFIKHTPEHLKPLYCDIATPIYTQEVYRIVSLHSIIKTIIEEHNKRR